MPALDVLRRMRDEAAAELAALDVAIAALEGAAAVPVPVGIDPQARYRLRDAAR